MRVFLVLGAVCAIACAAPQVEPLVDPEVELPSYMPICYRDDPQLGACIKATIQQMIPEMHHGIESIGFPALDPYTTESSYFEYKRNEMFGSLQVKNAKTYGMGRVQILDARATADDDSMQLEVDVHFPKLIMEGKYKAEGRYNAIKLVSKGYFNITFTDIKTTWVMAGHTKERNGELYMRIDDFDMAPEVGDMKIYASGLFPDPGLNQIALEFVNQYWPLMYKEMLPDTRKVWGPMIAEIVNKMFLRVPYRRLLPKSSE